MVRLFALFFILFGLPAQAFAGVFVSEVAWMGTDVSASNEWVELYNDNDISVDLTGWTLKAKDGSPSIALSGLIASRAYFLIERTDDDSVPNITADLVTTFGKGISNEGETLDLKDSTGALVDTVKGGKDWKSVGGDAKTKFTAQKRGSVWITAKATPRAAPPVPPPPPEPTPVIEKKAEAPLPAPSPIPRETIRTLPAETTSSSTQEPSQPTLTKVYDATPSQDQEKHSSMSVPLLGALLLFGSGGIVYLRGRAKTEAEKYEIIEDETDE